MFEKLFEVGYYVEFLDHSKIAKEKTKIIWYGQTGCTSLNMSYGKLYEIIGVASKFYPGNKFRQASGYNSYSFLDDTNQLQVIIQDSSNNEYLKTAIKIYSKSKVRVLKLNKLKDKIEV